MNTEFRAVQEYTFPEETNITDFHLYAVEWEPEEIRYYVDGECYYTLTDWYSKNAKGEEYQKGAPFDTPFYILLNMAIGGNFDPQADTKNTVLPAQMEVDFVRVYHKIAN